MLFWHQIACKQNDITYVILQYLNVIHYPVTELQASNFIWLVYGVIRSGMQAIIKFCGQLGYLPKKMFEMLQQTRTCTRNKISRIQVFEWHQRFRDGRRLLDDDKGGGWKSSVDTTLVMSFKDIVDSDR